MRLAIRSTLRAFLVLGGLAGGVRAVARAQQGTVAGRVTDQASGQPLVGARVVLVGTSLIARTNADGRYTVPGAPQGRVTVRASAVGYGAASRVAAVAPGDTAVVDLALGLAPYSLDEVVVTSTGDEARKQVGTSIARIDAAKLVETAPIANVTDLLIAKAAGVDVLPGTVTGAPSRVRIRGTNSLSLTNEPVYFVDGIRVTSQNRSSGICDVGCAPPSRINDLNPEDFESVEVAKGPAASALYGTDAANGVVVIKTKHGQPGKARWNVYAEQGVIKDNNDYPDAYRGWYTNPRTATADSSSQPRNGVQCFLSNTARLSSDAAYCLQDSVSRFNLFTDPQTTPLGTGHRQQYGVQVSGGSAAVRYYMSGEWEDELGQTKMPSFAVDSLLELRQISAVPDNQLRPNGLRRTSIRANVAAVKTGFKQDDRTTFFQYTLDVNGTASFTLSPTLTSRTTVGAQYFKTKNDLSVALAENLAGGATTVTGGAIPTVRESTTVSATVGAFVEQQFGYKDRLFLNGGLRADDNSAFGRDFKTVYYPKLSVSYVISDEPFFPKLSWINSVRLRAAIGASGVQPGTTDAARFFLSQTASVNAVDIPSLVYSAVGNTALKPERAREYEVGGEATMFNSRAYLELTYYNKRTKDALIARQVPPSAGGPITRFENLGAVVNRGLEALANLRILDKPSFGFDVTVNAAYNTNFIADMGGLPPIVGTTTRQTQGYPINGWWQRPYTYRDVDGNGVITACNIPDPPGCGFPNEVFVADSAVFVGYANPRWEVVYVPGFDLFNKRLRIQGLFDHKSGYYQLNGTERIRCESRLNCDGLLDPNAPLWKQARVVALRETPSRTQWGFIEKATFVRLREASATYELPPAWAQSFRATRASFTLAVRNLWKATGFSGIDPEANYFEGATGIVSNCQTSPPPTYWTFRLNVGF